MPTAFCQTIAQYAGTLPDSEPLSATTFLHLGTRRSINRALAELARQGSIARICRGIYVRVLESRFGKRLPTPIEVIRRMANSEGDTVVPHGAAAANSLRLSLQVPIREIYLTTGRPRKLQFGKATFRDRQTIKRRQSGIVEKFSRLDPVERHQLLILLNAKYGPLSEAT